MSQVDIPPIVATKHMKKIMSNYFLGLDKAARQGLPKIAWCTSVGPAELLLSMGFIVYYPENHSALLGANRTAVDVIPFANAIGYSPDVCSYLTADIGAFLNGITPLRTIYGIESIPKPDVLIFNTNQCRDVVDWFSFYARYWNIPLAGIYSHRGLGEIKQHHIDDIVIQFKNIIPVLESIGGTKFDLARLREILYLSKECTIRWRKVLEYASYVPTPMTFFDYTVHMAPAVVLRGTQEAVEYYDLLLAELKDRVRAGIVAVPNERFRLYWDGMPIWGRLRMLSETIRRLETAIVASTYCNSWIFDSFDPIEPFESMAWAYLELFITRSDDFKEHYIHDWSRRFGVHGIIFHDAKTCPNNSNNRYAMPERLSKKLSIPTLTINGDLNDLRCFSDEQTRTKLEAFIEQLVEIQV